MLKFLSAWATNSICRSAATTIVTREFGKFFSKAGRKRLRLTTKRLGRGYYKGNRGTKEGRLTSKGNFIVNPLRRLELVVPDLTGFRLKPYIEASAHKLPPELRPEKIST